MLLYYIHMSIWSMYYIRLFVICCSYFVIICGSLAYFFPFWYVAPRKIWQPCPGHGTLTNAWRLGWNAGSVSNMSQMSNLPGTDSTKLHFGRKLFGQIFSLKFRTNFPLHKTTDVIYLTVCIDVLDFKSL
jgi:hypothetical protein